MTERLSTLELVIREPEPGVLPVEMSIDGRQFGDRCVDLVNLRNSVLRPGGHFVLTCGCGSPECAGIFEPVFVEHSGGRILWECSNAYYPVPARNDPASELPDESTVGLLRYAFDRRHYLQEISAVYRRLRAHPRLNEDSIGPHGFDNAVLDAPFPEDDEKAPPMPAATMLVIGYRGRYRQPYFWIDGESDSDARKLVRRRDDWLAFGRWAGSWSLNSEPDTAGKETSATFYSLSPEVSAEQNNRAAQTLARTLQASWGEATVVQWERLLSTRDGRPDFSSLTREFLSQERLSP